MPSHIPLHVGPWKGGPLPDIKISKAINIGNSSPNIKISYKLFFHYQISRFPNPNSNITNPKLGYHNFKSQYISTRPIRISKTAKSVSELTPSRAIPVNLNTHITYFIHDDWWLVCPGCRRSCFLSVISTTARERWTSADGRWGRHRKGRALCHQRWTRNAGIRIRLNDR